VQARGLARRKSDPVAVAAGGWLLPLLAQRFGEVHQGIEKEY
jgi:hypothetical protein